MRLLTRLRFLHRARKARRDERDEIDALCSLLRVGDLAVDVGAYKGSHLCWMRRAVGERGHVLAFEPQPALAAYLREAVAACGWRNVEIRAQGVSARTGSLELEVPGAPGAVAPGASFALPLAEGGPRHRIATTTVTLDELFPDARVPALVKCDVEGHELDVLRGGEQLLRRVRPALLLECEERHGGSPRAVAELLASWGYSGEFFGPDGLRPVAEFRADVHQQRTGARFWDRAEYCNNFLFRPRE
jgi:FkbM family methyltransferase